MIPRLIYGVIVMILCGAAAPVGGLPGASSDAAAGTPPGVPSGAPSGGPSGTPAKAHDARPAAAGDMLPAGYLHTKGSQIVGATGVPVRIAAIGWNGGDGGRFVPEGLYGVNYRQTMNAMKALGINTIRLPWCDTWVGPKQNVMPVDGGGVVSVDPKLNPDLKGLSALQVTDRIIAYAGQIRLKVILDHHNNSCQGGQQTNGLWYNDQVSVEQFEQNWLSLARRYKGNDTVIGYDLDNEPLETAGWGSGGVNDWHAEAQRLGRMIQAVDPGPLIIVEGPQTWNPRPNMPMPAPSGNLQGVRTLPVVLTVPDKVVYSPHEYPPSVGDFKINRDAPRLIPYWNRNWGYLVKDNIAPVWIGEMGSSLKTETDRRWAHVMMGYLNGDFAELGGPSFNGNQQPIGGTWWCWGHFDDWIPNGILANWNGTPRPDQYAVFKRLLMRTPRADQ
jgi:endoglucanase